MKIRRPLTLFTLLGTLILSGTFAPAEEPGSGVSTVLGSGTISGYVDSAVVGGYVNSTVGGARVGRSRRTEQSGVVVHVWYPGYCNPPEPGVGPWCTMPRPYYGAFSVFTPSGRHVASASTAEEITATFMLHLQPGRYIIVSDDPSIDFAMTVTVRAKHFTEVMIWIAEE